MTAADKSECFRADTCSMDPACVNWVNCGTGGEADEEPQPKPREIGPIELAVEEDLAGMQDKIKAGRYALAALARKLARVLDRRGDEEPASQTAKAVDTLRITMNQIAAGEEVDANVKEQLEELLGRPSAGGSAVSAEIRYPKVT